MSLTGEQFAEQLVALQLVGADELAPIVSSLSTTQMNDAHELARQLVQLGKITKYQAAAVYQFRADSLVCGNYLVIDRIGAGATGQVFKARHRQSGRLAAIKIISTAAAKNLDAFEQLEREVKAAAQWSHPNIVKALDAGLNDGVPYLAVEYVDGPDLENLAKRHERIPLHHVCDFISQAALGLAFVHAAGGVHRHIKPGHLLVGSDGVVKILDMGLTPFDDDPNAPADAIEAESTPHGTAAEAVDYLAPEQAENTFLADAKADVYSLGCVLYRLLTGKSMYEGATRQERILAHRDHSIPALRRLRADASAALEQLHERMTAKKPADRPKMQEVVDALGSLTAGSTAVETATPPDEARSMLDDLLDAETSSSTFKGSSTSLAMSMPMSAGSLPPAELSESTRKLNPLIPAAVVVAVVGFGFAMWYVMKDGDRRPVASVSKTPKQPPAAAEIAGDFAMKPTETATSVVASAPPTTAPAMTAATATAATTEEKTAVPAAPVAAAIPTVLGASATMSVGSQPPTSQPPSAIDNVAASNVPAAQSSPDAIASAAPPPSGMPEAPPAPTASLPPPPEPAIQSVPAGAPAIPVPVQRRPVPPAATLQNTRLAVRRAFKDDYEAARQPDQKGALAAKLLTVGLQTNDDYTARYSLLTEVIGLAGEGEVMTFRTAVDSLVADYDLPAVDTTITYWEDFLRKVRTTLPIKPFVDEAIARSDYGVRDAHFDEARRYNEFATTWARKLKDNSLVKLLADRMTAIEIRRKQWDDVTAALERLATSPNDATANLAVGRYCTVVLRDWTNGLPLLVKGSDPVFKALAEKCLLENGDAVAQLALADQWFTASKSTKPPMKFELLAGAAYWYGQCLPGLSGPQRGRSEERLNMSTANALTSKIPATILTLPANVLTAPQTMVVDNRPVGPPVAPGMPGTSGGNTKALAGSPENAGGNFPTSPMELLAKLMSIGTVGTIDSTGYRRRLTTINELPPGGFDLYEVNITKGQNFTDDDLVVFSKCDQLENLRIENSRISGRGLIYLKDLPRLQILALDHAQLNDVAMAPIAAFLRLQILSLADTPVGDGTLFHLQGVATLRNLTLNRTHITDAGMPFVARMQLLDTLRMNETAISDEGIACLARMQDLKILTVGSTRVTDLCIPILMHMAPLTGLDIRNNKLSDAGFSHLELKFPLLER